MSEAYRIPAQSIRSELVIRKSRFLTTVAPAATVTRAREFLAAVRAEMPEASHHVYRFLVGFGNTVTEGMSDDGEPTGTAGPPTLAVLRGSGIGDIALVTTRYLGLLRQLLRHEPPHLADSGMRGRDRFCQHDISPRVIHLIADDQRHRHLRQQRHIVGECLQAGV